MQRWSEYYIVILYPSYVSFDHSGKIIVGSPPHSYDNINNLLLIKLFFSPDPRVFTHWLFLPKQSLLWLLQWFSNFTAHSHLLISILLYGKVFSFPFSSLSLFLSVYHQDGFMASYFFIHYCPSLVWFSKSPRFGQRQPLQTSPWGFLTCPHH